VKSIRGLTLIEVMIALAVLSIALAGFTALLLASMRQDLSSGKRTQAAQILNHLGRLQVGGDARLLAKPGEPIVWDYGQLGTAFPELQGLSGAGDPDLYKVVVTNEGTPAEVAAIGVGLDAYQISVCWKTGTAEDCIRGETLSSPPSSGGTPPPLPLIN